MPLRDHFRPPLDNSRSWDELHGGWPMMIVQRLSDILPKGYVAAPNVHLGTAFEIDIATFEQDKSSPAVAVDSGGNGVATASWAPPAPTMTVEGELSDQDEYEVRVYDARRGRELVATIELVSPSNKDRPERRQVFVTKVAALLLQDVCVSIVDVVTTRQANLYADLLAMIGKRSNAVLGPDPPSLYATTLRRRKRPRGRPVFDAWFYPLAVGRPLPSLPIWLDVDLGVTLDLEASYEDTCRVLRIP